MEQEYGIKDVCKLLNLSEVYVRRMILKGKLLSRKIEIRTNTYKHLISESEIKRWRGSLQQGNKREDGRSKFTLYSTKEEYDKIMKLLEDNNIESEIKRSNKVKEVTNEQ